jgi:excinuclease ABC subunit C
MKNPRSYTYIKISINEKFPNIETTGESDEKDGNIYFGPYTSKNTVERGLQGIKEYFKILCTGASHKTSSCLNYSLGLCVGPCSADFPKQQYLAILDRIIKLLNGTDRSVIKAMEYNMENFSEQLHFESAAKYRDYLRAVNYLVGKAKVINYTEKNKNIVVFERISDESIKCFLIKGNKVLFNEMYAVKSYDHEKLKAAIKANVLTCFNSITQSDPIRIGHDEIDEAQIVYSYLNSKSSGCRHVIISERWLKPSNSERLDNALDKLLLNY